ncbi:hypothetical protein BR93DRAFT_977960 [Coniochaeta sp. PMI_546]|nr:hypothetical protein BR93DRAFT_977960 [Coniochaeta sp. PMI_546]
MAVTNFLAASGPAELLVCIFQQCATASDVLALAATCQHTRRVWQAHGSAIISKVGPREIPAFNEALIAARVTQLVVDAEARGDRPPTEVPLHDLSGHRPTAADLPLVRKLHHLARVLEVAFCHHDGYWPIDLGRGPPKTPPEEPEDRMAEWTERLHKAIYRTLIAGAALAGVYAEPLTRAEDEGVDTEWPSEQRGEFKDSRQLAFLEKFAPYNIASGLEEEEALYGPVAAWILQSILADDVGRAAMAKRFGLGLGRAEICQTREDCPVKLAFDGAGEGNGDGRSDSDAHFVVWQIIQMAWVLQHIEQTVCRRTQYGTESQRPLKLNESSLCRVPVVFLGIFQPEIVTVPEQIDQGESPSIRADSTDAAARLRRADDQTICYQPNCYPQELTVRVLLENVYWHTRQPNHIVGDVEDRPNAEAPVPPLHFKFFEYFLRRYLGLRFELDAWSVEPEADNWELFASNFGLFAHDDVEGRESYAATGSFQVADFTDGSEILVSAEPTPTRVYEYFS